MDLSTMVAQKFKQNIFQYRNLCESNTNGILSCGYVQKNTRQGSHIDNKPTIYSGILVLSGEGYYKDKKNEKIPTLPGNFFQRFPGHKHSTIVTSDDYSEIYLGIGPSLFETLKEVGVIACEKPVLSSGLDYTLIEQMIHFVENVEAANSLELSLLVSDAIAIISRANYLDKKNAHTSDVLDMLAMSCDYMKEHVCLRLSVEDIANHVNIGYEKFRKLFTNHYGVSPGMYMIQQRINHAQKMLSENTLSIQEIALRLGYSDAYIFSKQFKTILGMSPTEFKKMYLL